MEIHCNIVQILSDRQYDYENYLATLLMTKPVRSPAFVIRAFNAEVSRIQDQASDPQIAAMRHQFWQDTLSSMYKSEQHISKIPANPVAKEMFKVCVHYNLPKRYLERLVVSRRHMLTKKYYNTLEELENYAENSVSSIYYLLLCLVGVSDVHADHTASHLGKAQGITNILRSVQIASHHKSVYLPLDILMKHNVSQESVLRCLDNATMRDVVFEIASRANSHIEKARSIEVPKTAKQIFLPAVTVSYYLKKLQKTNFNIFDKTLHNSGVILPLTLYYNRVLNKF
ncbi:NADH dehydrogenase (ubiquinone) complex I, assembly factor 6 isoform X2 [Aricia agestis]|uniref:NADH dehydrogenase (ubiquinone) complex I, assembly factor 6 isoform X2 n=1 Tax=Aricia agestis TaxID=91739 RepID=UPI001C20B1F4|nr:NADH dehydrogenase (ubiquinone) complex I, assembly factor 6 isoform X2 [Aricia agestis]